MGGAVAAAGGGAQVAACRRLRPGLAVRHPARLPGVYIIEIVMIMWNDPIQLESSNNKVSI